jgi:predicted nucleic acid-binding protein
LIAVDSSSAIAYLDGETGSDIDRMDREMAAGALRLPPPVLTELLSSPLPHSQLRSLLDELPVLPLVEGFWQRVGECRALIYSKGLKAHLADAMVAQVCIDLGIPLITRDRDVRHFAQWCGLELAV